MGSLTAISVKNAKPGRHIDGNGLYLLVKDSGAKSWVLRVQKDGKRRDFGLGALSDLTLAEARDKAAELRKAVRAGFDPVAEKKKARNTVPSFETAARQFHTTMKAGWTPRHAVLWLDAMEKYAFPIIGEIRVDHVDARSIRDALEPIWLKMPETGRRMRQRIGAVLDYAYAEKWRADPSPTRVVSKLLTKQIDQPKHREAMPFADVPAFMQTLRNCAPSIGRQALMFTILTAARSGEVRSLVWSEVNLEEGLWHAPAHKMKARRPHTVPLSAPAVAILRTLKGLFGGEDDKPVFLGLTGRAISEMTMTRVLRDAKLTCTTHGFRSSFRDWASEETLFQNDVVESALAHINPNAVERAYKRTTFFEKRRQLMDAWASYLDGSAGAVVRLAATG